MNGGKEHSDSDTKTDKVGKNAGSDAGGAEEKVQSGTNKEAMFFTLSKNAVAREPTS